MSINDYIASIKHDFKIGQATEHSYRPALKALLEEYVSGRNCAVINEPKRQTCGAPDYIVLKNHTPIGYVETKDIGKDLNNVEKSDQLTRYRSNLPNLILTDYLEFRLYRNGEQVKTVQIAHKVGNKIQEATQEKLDELNDLLEIFANFEGLVIANSRQLAKLMGKKAQLIQEGTLETILYLIEDKTKWEKRKEELDEKKRKGEEYDEIEEYDENELMIQYENLRDSLIHDITPEVFADLYAQTITYGLFAARLSTDDPDKFTRESVGNLIPETNPLLRMLFKTIEDTELKESIGWVIDELITVFKACNIDKMLQKFNQVGGRKDPFMHFYESFLKEYNPKLRKQKGVYYTPEPIVDFMVRSVDEILQKDFNIPKGLADTSEVKNRHRVQILDPATGTGTFLYNIIKRIHSQMEGQEGVWSGYVDKHLLPRIHGFELLMAPYAMCHLKIGMFLRDTGYKPVGKKDSHKRLSVYLTNSLQEVKDEIKHVSKALSQEFTAAKRVKKQIPIMVVVGNPPYSVASSNNSAWILELLKSYKKDLNERNIQPLNDDYIKFIRLGQEYINQNGSGILAFITNNSFIDGLIHRQMRKDLLESFDKIYILDLHGNSNRKEICPDGSKDENVFKIQQGVSINFFVKTNEKTTRELGKVFHYEMMGLRKNKFDFLHKNTLNSIPWKILENSEPSYFFVPKDFSLKEEYEKGFKIDELFENFNSGVKTHHDEERVSFSPFQSEYNQEYAYRPFDNRYIDYNLTKVVRHRYNTMRLMLEENIGLVVGRQSTTDSWGNVQVVDRIIDNRFHYSSKGISTLFPLYFYPKMEDGGMSTVNLKSPNFTPSISRQFAQLLGLKSADDLDPLEVFDYIYAVLHSPSYREMYAEFLKIDFPRIPYPENAMEFHSLAEKGTELRELHLMKDEAKLELITQYPVAGNNFVEKVKFQPECTEKGKIYINSQQYFANVPISAWEFYIGGYQPLQKYMKDRKNRTLSYEEIEHYQRIVKVIVETMRIMKEIG